MKYAIFMKPEVPVYLGTYTTEINKDGQTVSAVSDECLYGNTCRILNQESGWAEIISSHGYNGFVKDENLLLCTEAEIQNWVEDTMVTMGSSTDILTAPTVHGDRLLTLPRGSMLKPVIEAETGKVSETDGWTQIELPDGRKGYVPSVRLGVKKYKDCLLFENPDYLIDCQRHAGERRKIETGGNDAFDFAGLLEIYYEGSEENFRKALTDTAISYLGTQYRWAGRSSRGIDCSGMVGMSYLLNGTVIYRDASIVKGYPLKRLNLKWEGERFSLENLDRAVSSEDDLDDLRPGDALFFPGHVAMYLGDGMYIHSTGKTGSNGVVYNSLRPEHELFRQDLLDGLYAVGGLRMIKG